MFPCGWRRRRRFWWTMSDKVDFNKEKPIVIALAGNPNSGKTTIFNNITGTRQKVGNWPGVTVEKKEGRMRRFGRELVIVDLPGTYSLTPFSIEEIVARDFVMDHNPDVVINIIDASSLERSLYLATQIRELDCKVIFALNMADLARERGISINAEKLSELLDLPVVFTVGNKNQGVDDLLKAAVSLADANVGLPHRRRVKYSPDIETAIKSVEEIIRQIPPVAAVHNPRWTAIKLLENDRVITERAFAAAGPDSDRLRRAVDRQRATVARLYDDDPEIVMTDERYGFISGIIKEVVSAPPPDRVDISRKIDLVLTNRVLGFPIFIFFIWAMFQLTFTVGQYPVNGIEAAVSALSAGLSYLLPESLFKDLLLDGVVAGVGSVIVFLPNILILFFCIALFEDTGYMARSAFLMDKIMHLIGLHGKSFIPMLIGFGCNVPAVMAARTLESEKDRLLTILITPFMSCSAKLPVYVVLAGTFFGPRAGTVIFGVYLLGIVVSIGSGRLLRSTLLKGSDAPFVMELPPYRVPMLKSLFIHMWDRGKIFLKKMGGIILAGSVVIWSLSAFPRTVPYSMDYDGKMAQLQAQISRQEAGADRDRAEKRLSVLTAAKHREKMEKSWMGRMGRFMAPVFEPLGIDWRGGVALASGFVAKEIVVSTLGVLYVQEDKKSGGDLPAALKRSGATPLSALSMMVFVLLYLPCIATISAIHRETASWKWTLFSISYSTALAYLAAFFIYAGGRLLGYA